MHTFDGPVARNPAPLADADAPIESVAAVRPPSLAARIEEVAAARGVAVGEVRASVVAAVEEVAREVFGDGRRVEAIFDEGTGEIALYLLATVVERVERPGLELAIEDAQARIQAAVGEEIGLQIFYLEGHEEMARVQEREFGALFALDEAYRRAVDRFRALVPEVVARVASVAP